MNLPAELTIEDLPFSSKQCFMGAFSLMNSQIHWLASIAVASRIIGGRFLIPPSISSNAAFFARAFDIRDSYDIVASVQNNPPPGRFLKPQTRRQAAECTDRRCRGRL
jgi:hypothetical protein